MRSGNPQSYSAAKSRKPSQPSTANAAAAAPAAPALVVQRSQRATPGKSSSSASIASSGSYGSLRNPGSNPEWHLRHVTALLLVAGALACFTSVWLLMKVLSRADNSTRLTGLSIRALHVVEQAKPHVMLATLKEDFLPVDPCINETLDLDVVSQFLLPLSAVTPQPPPPPHGHGQAQGQPQPQAHGQGQAQGQAQGQGQEQLKSNPGMPVHITAAELWTSPTGDNCRRWQVGLQAVEISSSDASNPTMKDSGNGSNVRNDAMNGSQGNHAPVVVVLQFDDVSSDREGRNEAGEQVRGKGEREREREKSRLGGPHSFAAVDARREGWPSDERFVAASVAVIEAMHVRMTFWSLEREAGGGEAQTVNGVRGRLHSAVPLGVRDVERGRHAREVMGVVEAGAALSDADTSAGAGAGARVHGAAESTWRSIRKQWEAGPLMARLPSGTDYITVDACSMGALATGHSDRLQASRRDSSPAAAAAAAGASRASPNPRPFVNSSSSSSSSGNSSSSSLALLLSLTRLRSSGGAASGSNNEPVSTEAQKQQEQHQHQQPPTHPHTPSHPRMHSHSQSALPLKHRHHRINCSLISLPRLHYVAAPPPPFTSPSHPHPHAANQQDGVRGVSAKSASGRGRSFPVARLLVAWESNCNVVTHALVACRVKQKHRVLRSSDRLHLCPALSSACGEGEEEAQAQAHTLSEKGERSSMSGGRQSTWVVTTVESTQLSASNWLHSVLLPADLPAGHYNYRVVSAAHCSPIFPFHLIGTPRYLSRTAPDARNLSTAAVAASRKVHSSSLSWLESQSKQHEYLQTRAAMLRAWMGAGESERKKKQMQKKTTKAKHESRFGKKGLWGNHGVAHEKEPIGGGMGDERGEEEEGEEGEEGDELAAEDEFLHVAILSDTEEGGTAFRRHLGHIKAHRPTADVLFHVGNRVEDPSSLDQWHRRWVGPLQSSRVGPSIPLSGVLGHLDLDSTGAGAGAGARVGTDRLAHVFAALPSSAAATGEASFRPPSSLSSSPPSLGGTPSSLLASHLLSATSAAASSSSKSMSPGWFAMVLGDCLWIGLDSSINGSSMQGLRQTAFLRDTLRTLEEARVIRAAPPFVAVLVHMPPFVDFWDVLDWKMNEKVKSERVRKEWVPLFERHHVDVVISGHSHAYQRGERNGVAYVILGGGGGRIDKTRVEDWGMYKVTHLGHHYVRLDISKHVLSWTAYDATNNPFDHVLFVPDIEVDEAY